MEQGLLHDVSDSRILGVSVAHPAPDHPSPETPIVMGSLLATTQVPRQIHRPDGRLPGPVSLSDHHHPLSLALHAQNHRLHHHFPHHGRRFMVRRRQLDLPLGPDGHLQLLRLLRLRLLHHATQR